MYKIAFYTLLLTSMTNVCISQSESFTFLEDSIQLKKELIEAFLVGKNKSRTIINERSSTYQANLILKNNKTYRRRLRKYFSEATIKNLLLDENEDLHSVIHWTDIYKNQPKDSITFIWERQVDDFLHIDDSIVVAQKNVKDARKFLWYVATEEFMVTLDGKVHIYAIVYSYPYQDKEQYGCDIDLYEKQNNKWSILWRFTQATQQEIELKKSALKLSQRAM